jgi:peptidoglycan/LPS O-acetylase OafA/YrhL
MRLLGRILVAIGLLIAFGYPSAVVLRNTPFSLWEIVIPIVVGALFVFCGNLMQRKPKRASGRSDKRARRLP